LKERIKKVRKEQKLTQVEFGQLIGVKGNTVTNYESGLRTPTDAVIKSICREFNVNENWLRNGTGEMFVKPTRHEEISRLTKKLLDEEEDSFKNRLISTLANLTEDQWGVLAEIAEKLTKEKD
jgi:transcriptional regulator with XRE-family HTH domain